MHSLRNRALPAGILILITGALIAFSAEANKQQFANVELDYLKELHVSSPAVDPGMTPILLSHFINAKKTKEGIAFFKALENNSAAEDTNRYLASRAVLRAAHAEKIFLLSRKRWVKDTIALMDVAREATPDNLLVRWLIATTLAKIPASFGQQDHALTDLNWVLERLNQIPKDGLTFGAEREVFYQLAKLSSAKSNNENSDQYLLRSGYPKFDRADMFTTSFAASASAGLTFNTPTVTELVPGKVYSASGFEMMDFYFVISEDGTETISIDAGTRPSTARRAHEAVLEKYTLPPISTVLVTHAHWDHIGGASYFRELNSRVKFIARDNYEAQLNIIKSTKPAFNYFFSDQFSTQLVDGYQPDELISEESDFIIAGTSIRAIPLTGGETHDALAYHFADTDVTFLGDFIMPYVGAPFANEGDSAGLIDAINTIVSMESGQLLHGHKPLTDVFSSTEMLSELGQSLGWLLDEVRRARKIGLSLPQIHQLNLTPKNVFNEPSIQLAYFVIREGFISRFYQQHSGYWEANLQGMDYLSQKNIAHLLGDYLGISKEKFIQSISKLLSEGHYDAALKLSAWGVTQYPDSDKLKTLRVNSLNGLRNKYQNTNPFKFLIYSESMQSPVPPMRNFK